MKVIYLTFKLVESADSSIEGIFLLVPLFQSSDDLVNNVGELSVFFISLFETLVNGVDHLGEVRLFFNDLSLVLSIDEMLRGESHKSRAELNLLFLNFGAVYTSNDFNESNKELDITLDFIELFNVHSNSNCLKVSISLREDCDKQIHEDQCHNDRGTEEENSI